MAVVKVVVVGEGAGTGDSVARIGRYQSSTAFNSFGLGPSPQFLLPGCPFSRLSLLGS